MKPEDLGLTDAEFATMISLMARVVQHAKGVCGELILIDDDTGHTTAMHLDLHDAVLCECARLDHAERTIQ